MDESGVVVSPLSLLSGMSGFDFVSVAFTVMFGLWAIYTLVSIYHWIRYGKDSWIAWPAIGAHLVISAALMLFAVSGFK